MPFKLAVVALPPLCITCIVLRIAGVPWDATACVAAVVLVFLVVIGLCDRLRHIPSPWLQQQLAASSDESMAAPPQEAALGLGASAIADLPAYKYNKVSGGGTEECSVCLGEINQKETVIRLPACTHLFHEGCIHVWLRSHRTCPVCRTPVDAVAVPVSVEIDGRTQGN
ncbi:hypothetical protein U9M48_027467 [Paspalum notatum var. saurae]|uniref:RING-type E3 ubiquitin transferase n=1 Tax=Paspalum notatum var. saurae TaxID=547442 RepID=A0AAQ3X046_PASNO